MIFLRPRICLWVCLSLLTILSRGDGLSAQAETPHGSSNVKVTRHPNMDAPGNDATWVRGITSVEQCESMCLANGACAGYTYNIKQSACFQKSAIGPLAPSSVPTITGVVDRQSGGLAAQNRAITIVGKPSFDCRKAKSETAQAICGSTRLIQLDLQLAKLFWAKMAKLSGSSAEEEKRRQLDWGVGRNQCSADAACVEQSYQRRIAELGGQALASTAPPSQTPPPPVQQVAEQKPQLEMEPERKEFRTSVQQLPNPIRLIGQADQPCDVASATLARLRKTLSVSVPDGLTVQAEDLRSFMWKTSGAPPLGPAYLVLAADAPVRVQGTGSYALTPDAKAPFRIKQFLQQTRVIIPLHVKDAPQSGEVKIRPLIAGPLKVSAAIIGYTQCGESPDPAPIAFDLTVEPGAPEIVVADRFDLAKPDQIIASPDGTRRLEIFGPRYRLIDVATGALLADTIGREVHFSPTGRFVIAVVENNFVIRDSVDGNIAREQIADSARSDYTLAWDDRDSFIIATTGRVMDSTSYVLNSLDDKDAKDISFLCDIGAKNESFRLDLENNIVVCIGSGNVEGEIQTGSLTISVTDEERWSVKTKDLLFAARVVSLTMPESWDMINGLKITHLESDESPYVTKSLAAILAPFVVRPFIVAKDDTRGVHATDDPLRVASRGLVKSSCQSRNSVYTENSAFEILASRLTPAHNRSSSINQPHRKSPRAYLGISSLKKSTSHP